ncbi:MAG: DnaJ domain-containing protein [Thermodesulfobacteriota bacterium]
MADFIYRQRQSPGCGGCLLVLLLITLATGGAPVVINLLGALFFFFLLLVVGGIGAMYAFSYFVRRQVAEYAKNQTETHNRFVTLLIHILVKVAQTDGEVTREETAIIANFFRQHLRYNQQQMFWVKEVVKEALASTAPLEGLLEEFRRGFAHEARLILVELVYQILFTKPQVPAAELELAARIAAFLGLSVYEQQAILGKYQAARGRAADDEVHYYQVLGLAPGADLDEVKRAYRKLSMQYHPDKVAHLGEEFKAVAEEKMKEINVAYTFLSRKLGGR